MDPNETLKKMLKLAQGLVDEDHDDFDMQQVYDAARRGVELAELVLALNEWVKKGGFPPQEWRR